MFSIRSIFGVCFVGVSLIGNVVADSTIDGKWSFRGNGTATGYIEISGNNGVLQSGSSQVDTISNIQLSSAGGLGQRKLTFSRTGQYPQAFIGWLSYDSCQMAGYFVREDGQYLGEEFAWDSYKNSCDSGTNNSGQESTVESNLDIHIPSATFGDSNIWVDLEYKGASGFDHLWRLKDYGAN